MSSPGAGSNCALINIAHSIGLLTWSHRPSTVIEIIDLAIELMPPRSLQYIESGVRYLRPLVLPPWHQSAVSVMRPAA